MKSIYNLYRLNRKAVFFILLIDNFTVIWFVQCPSHIFYIINCHAKHDGSYIIFIRLQTFWGRIMVWRSRRRLCTFCFGCLTLVLVSSSKCMAMIVCSHVSLIHTHVKLDTILYKYSLSIKLIYNLHWYRSIYNLYRLLTKAISVILLIWLVDQDYFIKWIQRALNVYSLLVWFTLMSNLIQYYTNTAFL
jgi:hypothetical protein